MNLLKNQALAPLTTLKAGGSAKFFVEATTQGAIEQAVQFARKESLQLFVLGGGSNILVRDAGFPGLVLKIATRGIHAIESTANTTYLLAEAGEEWDALVGDSGKAQAFWARKHVVYPRDGWRGGRGEHRCVWGRGEGQLGVGGNFGFEQREYP